MYRKKKILSRKLQNTVQDTENYGTNDINEKNKTIISGSYSVSRSASK
jgi:hypothetical protein